MASTLPALTAVQRQQLALGLPSEEEIKRVDDLTGQAEEELERLVWRVTAVRDAEMFGGEDVPPLSFADIGRMWAFADGLRADAETFAGHAKEVSQSLSAFDEIRYRHRKTG